MDNFNDRDFYAENDWQSISQPVVKAELKDAETEQINTSDKPKKQSKHPVLTLQLTLSLCLLLFLFIVKFLGPQLYTAVISWYEDEISKSVIYNGDFEGFDFSSLFSTDDEA